jgi:AmmeMemoRadiSam system protein A
MFTEAQRSELVQIARDAVSGSVTGRPAAAPSAIASDPVPQASGAFVTLKKHGQLRGCIGTLECRRTLAEEIARAAVSAAREDPRFEPVRASELDDLDIEVSVLGPLEEIDPRDPDAIVIGRHGLVVEQGKRRGLLLPQVAPEWGWDCDEFLAHTCAKAGLPVDAWKNGAKVYRFAAEVFGD